MLVHTGTWVGDSDCADQKVGGDSECADQEVGGDSECADQEVCLYAQGPGEEIVSVLTRRWEEMVSVRIFEDSGAYIRWLVNTINTCGFLKYTYAHF